MRRYFFDLLGELEINLAVSSYQAGKLFIFADGAIGEIDYRCPMGVDATDDYLVVGATGKLDKFQTLHGAYLRVASYDIGVTQCHDVAVTNTAIVFVNTQRNCITDAVSGQCVWMPRFLDERSGDDCCHLNGLATVNGEPKYVTMCSQTLVSDGWKNRMLDGGVVFDISANQVVCSDLSMPHSPRWHEEKLYVLNSGRGEFGVVESEKFISLLTLPGFARGMDFVDNYAIVCTSKLRKTFHGRINLVKQLERSVPEIKCALNFINLNTNEIEAEYVFDNVRELFDVAVLPAENGLVF